MVLHTTMYQDIWDKILTSLKEQLNDEMLFNTFFNGHTRIHEITDETIVILADSEFIYNFINKRYDD